ncbi:hypothetical protein NQ176_g5539 [Zarea fungicola]|uniref:Uncharacterized protein n=1 Tax=Zarea fungicola TaxID=93591 RepID=A0ACC1NAD2_9HYPO|nr:hypothetical protein NQ176_g5539 [Lecanicillium fungicola]
MSEIHERILAAENVTEVVQLLNFTVGEKAYDGYSDSRFFKVNFTSLLKHKTIEFRQHEGTSDSRQIVRWVRTLVKMVEFARTAEYNLLLAEGETNAHLLSYVGFQK